MTTHYSLDQGSVSRRTFAQGAVATAVLAAAGLATPALADGTDAVSGASEKIDESLQMTQEEIHDLACDYLHGWPLKTDENGETVYSYREMYSIATSLNNHPGLSQVEFVLFPDSMCLLGSGDKGTEKCLHLLENPEAVMYWYHQVPEEEYVPYANDYFNSYGVQFKGNARFLTADEEGAAEKVGVYLETLYGAEAWGSKTDEERAETIARMFEFVDWIYFEPTEVVVNSLQWRYNSENSARPEWYDPESPSFGKSVRQVYHP